MFVGLMELHFALTDNESLKDKRSVVRRVQARTRQTFNVAMAEVDDQGSADRAVLAVVAVSGDRRYVEGLLEKVEDFVDRLALGQLLEAPKLIEAY